MTTVVNVHEMRTKLIELRSEIELDHEQMRQMSAKLVAKMRERDEIMLTLARQRLEEMD